MSATLISPAFGTPDYFAQLETEFAVEVRPDRAARFVLPKPVYGVLAFVALLLGLFGLAAITNGVSFISTPAPVQVEVVPADEVADETAGGTILIEVDAR